LNIKQVQNDTLSHLILSRASTFSLASTGDITFSTECIEASQIYLNNSQETPEFVARAFSSERYTQVGHGHPAIRASNSYPVRFKSLSSSSTASKIRYNAIM